MSHMIDWDSCRPASAINWRDEEARPGCLIKTYIPGGVGSVHRYRILGYPDHDPRGDILVEYQDLDTGEISTTSTAVLGLSTSPDGQRYCWAIPYDDE